MYLVRQSKDIQLIRICDRCNFQLHADVFQNGINLKDAYTCMYKLRKYCNFNAILNAILNLKIKLILFDSYVSALS